MFLCAQNATFGHSRLTSPTPLASLARRAFSEASSPMRPSANAAALATCASASSKRLMSAGNESASRLTPIEFRVPISNRPLSVADASRSAAPASGPGIASKAMRAHEASFSSASSGASAGTDSSCHAWPASYKRSLCHRLAFQLWLAERSALFL